MIALEVDAETLACLYRDGFGICRSCSGATDGVDTAARDRLCDHCGENGLAGMDELLVLGMIVASATA